MLQACHPDRTVDITLDLQPNSLLEPEPPSSPTISEPIAGAVDGFEMSVYNLGQSIARVMARKNHWLAHLEQQAVNMTNLYDEVANLKSVLEALVSYTSLDDISKLQNNITTAEIAASSRREIIARISALPPIYQLPGDNEFKAVNHRHLRKNILPDLRWSRARVKHTLYARHVIREVVDRLKLGEVIAVIDENRQRLQEAITTLELAGSRVAK
jgi:hypothetical protein